MKNIIRIAFCSICFLLAVTAVYAQKSGAPKITGAADAVKPAAKSTTTDAKTAINKNPEASIADGTAIIGNVKTVEIKPAIQNTTEPKNADRPKRSTLERAKGTGPDLKSFTAAPTIGN